MALMTHWLLAFPDADPAAYFWSGDGQLTLGGHDYAGHRGLIQMGAVAYQAGAPSVRATASIDVSNPTLRAAFLQDVGPLRVRIDWIYSEDAGGSWLYVPRSFQGRLSRPSIRDNTYTVEVETYSGTVARGVPEKWSHEYVQALNIADDNPAHTADTYTGFEQLRTLAQGIEIDWPRDT